MTAGRWIGRAFWLVLWGMWIFCGFGLARELPRASFRAACRLKLNYGEIVHGFLPGDDLIVVSTFEGSQPKILLLDPRTGRVVNECRDATDRRSELSLRHGVLIGLPFSEWPPSGRTASTTHPKKSLDLRTGEWTDLRIRSARIFEFHPERPWVAASLNDDETKPPHVAIIDFRTGERVAEIKGDAPPAGMTDLVHQCGFLSDDELLFVLERRLNPESKETRQRFERWTFNGERVDAPSELQRTYFHFGPLTRTWRIRCIGSYERGMDVDVLDARTGDVVATSTAPAPPTPLGFGRPSPSCSPLLEQFGRTFMERDCVLHDLETNEVLWRPNEFESVHNHCLIQDSTIPASVFGVSETWKAALPRWPDFLTKQTLAVRRMENGSVWFRTRGSLPQFLCLNDDGRFGVAKVSRDQGLAETVVYELPPPIDWVLLLVCQGLLAVPIIVIWLIARHWTRRQRRSMIH